MLCGRQDWSDEARDTCLKVYWEVCIMNLEEEGKRVPVLLSELGRGDGKCKSKVKQGSSKQTAGAKSTSRVRQRTSEHDARWSSL